MVDHRSSGENPITLRISYTAADFAEAARIYQRTTSMHFLSRLASIGGLLVAAWGLFLMGLDYYVFPNIFEGEFRLNLFESNTQYLIWVIIALILISVLSWIRPFRTLAIRFDFQQNKAVYQGPYHVTIDSQGIILKTSTTEGRQYWPAFTKVLENER
ncbi:MAG: hypothetical protein GTO14_08435 [Anaerolineales bacterium]|nr:hypothetical protein [Anaerolineales bacterium]